MQNSLHIALGCADIERSTDFYARLFDLAPDKVADGFARFQVSNPPLVLSLNSQERVKKGGRVQHLGLRLGPEEFQAARSRLLAAGLVRKEQSRTRCCHAIQDKVWARDPDGNDWEFYALLDDLEP